MLSEKEDAMSDGYGDIYTQDEFGMYCNKFVRSERFSKGMKGAACAICGTIFPLTKLVQIKGKYYCTVKGCADDFAAKEIRS